MVFERFTERARLVVTLAQEEAEQGGSITPSHLLLGLIREEEGIAARVLDALGVTEDVVRVNLGWNLASRQKALQEPRSPIPFTPASKSVLEGALHEALALGHKYVGTEHILLALAVGGRNGVLVDLGVQDKVRDEVIRMLTGSRQHKADLGPLTDTQLCQGIGKLLVHHHEVHTIRGTLIGYSWPQDACQINLTVPDSISSLGDTNVWIKREALRLS